MASKLQCSTAVSPTATVVVLQMNSTEFVSRLTSNCFRSTAHNTSSVSSLIHHVCLFIVCLFIHQSTSRNKNYFTSEVQLEKDKTNVWIKWPTQGRASLRVAIIIIIYFAQHNTMSCTHIAARPTTVATHTEPDCKAHKKHR